MIQDAAKDLPKDSDWIHDLVYLAFPEGEARERVLFDLVQQFSRMDSHDPEWFRYKLSVVECRALENVARSLNEAASEQVRLRGVTREISDYAATQLKSTIEHATANTRHLLEDVQLSLHDAVAGDAILKSYTAETRRQFAQVIEVIIEETLVRALSASQRTMDSWLKGSLDQAIQKAQRSLSVATTDFRLKLGGAWGQLLWACIACGVLAGGLLVAGGFWVGRRW